MKKPTGWTYLILAMLAFAGLRFDAVLVSNLESMVYHAPMESWTDLQRIARWVISSAVLAC